MEKLRALIEELLPDRRMSGRERQWWFYLFLLSPLAWLAGLFIAPQLAAHQSIYVSVDFEEATRRARVFAESQGIAIGDRFAFSAGLTNPLLHKFYRLDDNPVRQQLRRVRPEMVLRVAFAGTPEDQPFEATLTPDGRIVGFQSRFDDISMVRIGGSNAGVERRAPDGSASAMDEGGALARQVADDRQQEWLRQHPFLSPKGEPGIETDRDESAVLRTFTYRATAAEVSDFSLKHVVQVQNGVIVKESVDGEVAPGLAATLDSQPTWVQIHQVGLVLAGFLLSIYSFVLYVRRTLQGEVSHRRSFSLAVLIALAFGLVGILVAGETIALEMKKGLTDPTLWLALSGVFIVYLFVGGWFGILWGSSEGEVREAYPGKLTALDAWITGRIFSSTVARAVLTGTALGAWLFFLTMLEQYPFRESPFFGVPANENAQLNYTRMPGLLVLATPVLHAAPVLTLGLMVPLTFVHRWIRTDRWRNMVLVGMVIFACSGIGSQLSPPGMGMLASLVMAAAVLVSFLAFDLLTAFVTFGTSASVALAAALVSSSSSGLSTAVGLAVLGFGFLGLQVYYLFNGRVYRESEVRPLYAEHLAQRQSMRAEVSAARQAQLSLSPQSLPRLPGLAVAAVCEPAQEVGGDFFDFFPLNDGRLGLFFAEGGGGGLSAALTIAYTKGLLLPMVNSEADPEELVAIVAENLRRTFAGAEPIGFLFAMVDPAKNRLSCARLGEFPKLVFSNAEELSWRPASDSRPGIQVLDQEFQLGDQTVFFTNGVAGSLESVRSQSSESWMRAFLGRHLSVSAQQLYEQLWKELFPVLRKASRQGVEDDVSIVIVTLEPVVSSEQEDVA